MGYRDLSHLTVGNHSGTPPQPPAIIASIFKVFISALALIQPQIYSSALDLFSMSVSTLRVAICSVVFSESVCSVQDWKVASTLFLSPEGLLEEPLDLTGHKC